MKRNCLILTVLVAACVLLLQIGCEEQSVVASESRVAAKASKPANLASTGMTPLRKQQPVKAETAPQAGERGPEITVEKAVHDFGEIGPGAKKYCEFKFTNTGDSLLKITKVSRTCGCTPFTLEKNEYAPGESGTLKVKYNAGGLSGSVNRRLFIYSNDKERPKVTLTVRAKIVQKVAHEPDKLHLLFKDENASCPEITLTSVDGQPFAIKYFKSTANTLTADYDSSKEATRFVLQPKVDIEKLRERLDGSISIGLTHPECDRISIFYRTLPRFEVKPPSIVVYKVEPEEPTTREVWILNNYDEDFEVESVSSREGIIKVLSQEKIGNRYKFELEITPPALKGKRRIFTDVFFVNIKGGEKLKIRCNGFYLRDKSRRADKS